MMVPLVAGKHAPRPPPNAPHSRQSTHPPRNSPPTGTVSTGAVIAANGYGPDGWRARSYLQMSSGNQYYAYTYDPQGTLVQRAYQGSTNVGLDTAFYTAYGQPLSDTLLSTGGAASVHQPAGFGGESGYYTDDDSVPAYATGLLNLTHRYFDPSTGRFVTRDPIGYNGGANLYGFAGNNPVNRTDPNGTNAFTEWWHQHVTTPLARMAFGRFDSPITHANHGVPELYDIDGIQQQDQLGKQVGRGFATGMVAGAGIYASAALGALTGGEGPAAEAAIEERGFAIVANAGSEVRQVTLRPGTGNWGLKAYHIEKHLFGSGPFSLKTIDAGGNGDVWANYIADLFQSPVTSTTRNGMIDIIKTYPKTNAPGTFKLGIRLAPNGGGNYDLITILTKQ